MSQKQRKNKQTKRRRDRRIKSNKHKKQNNINNGNVTTVINESKKQVEITLDNVKSNNDTYQRTLFLIFAFFRIECINETNTNQIIPNDIVNLCVQFIDGINIVVHFASNIECVINQCIFKTETFSIHTIIDAITEK
eukprot:224432_1